VFVRLFGGFESSKSKESLQMKSKNLGLLGLAALGLVGGVAPVASAQFTINISGATLIRNFLIAPAATQDFLDVDGDGFARQFSTNDQLAPNLVLPFPPKTLGQNELYWHVGYRAIGSGNGFQELVDFGGPGFAGGDSTGPIRIGIVSQAFLNRNQYAANGLCANANANLGFPGGIPVTTNTTTRKSVWVNPGTGTPCNSVGAPAPAGTGYRTDMAIIDVPSLWTVQNLSAGTPAAIRLPGEPQYGTNPLLATNRQGVNTAFGNKLANLGPRNLFRPDRTPDANTIFDTPLAVAPIAVVVNFGVGLTQMNQSDLAHLSVTGRRLNGENLTLVTRDSGSGTRNAFQNALCVDPSFGAGENIGALSVPANESLAGPNFVPSNKVGNPEVEVSVQNSRIAIGYAGAERGINSPSWLSGGRLEVLGVVNDEVGGTLAARPTISNVLDNSVNGYRIVGPAVFATVGDPEAAPAPFGSSSGRPAMANPEAAKYLGNITRSVAAFSAAPGSDPTLFTPGEFLGANFILTAALDNLPNPLNPCDFQANAGLNQFLQEFTRGRNVLGNPAYASFGTVTLNGVNPTREVGFTYSDGVANGANYIDQTGAAVTYGQPLRPRNRIAGDFNGDGARTLADIPGMIAAWRERNGGPNWDPPVGTGPIAGAPGSDLVFEIVGDFNGDGNFNAKDVRYFADGLALNSSGNLDRSAGFTDVDAAFGGNFFGTALATPKVYANGDSRGDVASALGTVTPGWAPIGADGNNDTSDPNDNRIDAFDIDYVTKQYARNPAVVDGELNWDNTAEAGGVTFRSDLSADMNGDLKVNAQDLCVLVRDILGTQFGDVDLNGVVNSADITIITNNLGTPGGWARGDMDGDGNVTQNDLDIANGLINPCCPGDWNNDGVIDFNDLLAFLNDYNAQNPRADVNQDGVIDFNDLLAYLNLYNTTC
jgi:hypothetical protein